MLIAGVQGCGGGGSTETTSDQAAAGAATDTSESSATVDGEGLLSCLGNYQFTQDDFTYLAFSDPNTTVVLERDAVVVAYANVGPEIPGYKTRGDPGVDVYTYDTAATASDLADQVPDINLPQQSGNVLWLYAASGGESVEHDKSMDAFDKAITGCIENA